MNNFYFEWKGLCKRVKMDKNIRLARIAYRGSKGNAQKEWHKIRNPLRMLFTALVFEVLRKTPPLEIKNAIYRLFGIKIGKNVAIAYNVLFDPLYPELIEIGDNVLIGSDCEFASHEFALNWFSIGRVKIKNDVMISAYNLIAAGVTINDKAVTGLQSFVKQDIPSCEFWAGVPAKMIKKLPKEGLVTKRNIEIWHYERKH